MTDYKAIKIPAEDFERHKKRKEELGLSWSEYVDGQAPELGADVDEREIAKMVTTDLEGRLPRKIAEELR